MDKASLPRTPQPLAALIVLLMVASATSAHGALPPGTPAPSLSLAKWVKSGPVDLLNAKTAKGGHFFMIEFWATWCVPCQQLMPHLSSLQQKYKNSGLVVLGVSTENPALVTRFVEGRGNSMDFAVAVDDQRTTYRAYMQAAGAPGIPYAFVIDRDAKIAWHGPTASHELDDVLMALAGDSFDQKSNFRAKKARRLVPRYFAAKDPEKANEIGGQIVDLGQSDPKMLAEFAERILEDAGANGSPIALQAARIAWEGGSNDLWTAQLYARALHANGKSSQAAEIQRKAIQLCTSDVLRETLEAELKEYQDPK